MAFIKDEVYLGTIDEYNYLLSLIANYAQPEKWTFGALKEIDPYKILRNYFEHTYERISEENKFVFSEDNNFKCMNTGLITTYNQDVYAVFIRNKRSSGLPWKFSRVYKDTDTFIRSNFSSMPQIADYFDTVEDLIYDKNLKIELNINHIIDDNYQRFADIGYLDKSLINALLISAKLILEKRLLRNYKLALPFYYSNTQTKESKMQLLVPIYFPASPVRLALVLDKQTGADGSKYYEGITVLPVEWAYMNSRLIVKPDDEWVKLIDELDTIPEINNSADNIKGYEMIFETP